MRYHIVERRFYSYPTANPPFLIARKSVSIRLDAPDGPRVRGNIGDYRVWIFPERLEILWDRQAEWTVSRVCVAGLPDRKYSGVVFQDFDVRGPRVPGWIPPLVEMLWPIDEEVSAEWSTVKE